MSEISPSTPPMKESIDPRARDFSPSMSLGRGVLPASLHLGIFVAILFILLIAFALRFHHLGAQSLWHDEGNSYVQSTRSFFDIAANAGRDIHPPGYYWLLGVWRLLVGESEFGLRSLSAFASLMSVAFTFALGKRLFSPIVGLVAAAFVALNTFSIYYAQEARMYALLAMWAAAAMWAFANFLFLNRRDTKNDLSRFVSFVPLWFKWALILAVLNAAGLWTQYAYAFVMLAQGMIFVLWCAFTLRSTRRVAQIIRILGYYVAANVFTLLLYALWIPTAYRQITNWPNTGDAIPAAQAVSVILSRFAFGITAAQGTTISVAFFLLFGLLVFSPKDVNRGDSPSRPYTIRSAIRMLFPVSWAFTAVGIFLVFGLFREANLKFLLPAQIAFALWIGRGAWMLWHLPIRRDSAFARVVPRMAAVLGIFALLVTLWNGLNPLYSEAQFQRDDYRAIVARIMAEARPGDAIILNAPNQQEVFDYYYDGEMPIYALPRGLGGDDEATLAEVRQIISEHNRIYAVFWGMDERDPNHIIENTLDREAYEADNVWYGSVRLVRYGGAIEFESVQDSGARFGETIMLETYALTTNTVNAGDVLRLQLMWMTNAPLTTRYKVFMQLLDSNGVLVAQRDSEPSGGLLPTLYWAVDSAVTDNHALVIPPDLAAGDYTLIIGLYDGNNPSTRLPVDDGDYLTLSQITVR